MSAITTQSFHKDLFVVAQSKLDAMTDSELTALAKETNGKSLQAAKQTLLHVAQTGLVLIAIKEKRGHGNFMSEISIRVGITQRTANNYMAIARHYRNFSNLKNVSDALRYIKAAASTARGLDEYLYPPKIATPSPAPSRPTLSLGATYQDAEIVEPAEPATIEAHAEVIEPEPAPEPIAFSSGVKINKHFNAFSPFTDASNDDERAEVMRLKYPRACSNLEAGAEAFADMVKEVRQYQAWKFIGFDTFEDFCRAKLGKTIDEVEDIVEGVRILGGESSAMETIVQLLPSLTKDDLTELSKTITINLKNLNS